LIGKEAEQMHAPHWFEVLAGSYPWVIPFVAVTSLWLARGTEDAGFRRIAERLFFGALLLVAWGTLRTILSNEGCWIVHTSSMAAMIVGAIFPSQIEQTIEQTTEQSIS
jgi:hypothetical protein